MDDVDDKDFSPYQATTKESMMRRCSLRQKKKKLSGQNNFVAQGKGVGGGARIGIQKFWKSRTEFQTPSKLKYPFSNCDWEMISQHLSYFISL